MKISILTILSCFLLLSLTFAQGGDAPAPGGEKSNLKKIKSIKVQADNTVSYEGNLSEGQLLSDLRWAANSSVACFPATQNRKFTGKHLLYEIHLPSYSEMKITVIPTDKSQNFSLYAYSVGTTTDAVVPKLTRCVSCEADYRWDYKYKGKTQDHTRSIELRALNNPYKVYIGVAGAEQLNEGDFELQVEIKSR